MAINLYKAFAESRDRAAAKARELTGVYFELGLLPAKSAPPSTPTPIPMG